MNIFTLYNFNTSNTTFNNKIYFLTFSYENWFAFWIWNDCGITTIINKYWLRHFNFFIFKCDSFIMEMFNKPILSLKEFTCRFSFSLGFWSWSWIRLFFNYRISFWLGLNWLSFFSFFQTLSNLGSFINFVKKSAHTWIYRIRFFFWLFNWSLAW